MNSLDVQSKRRRRFDRIVAVMYEDMYRYAAWLTRDATIAEDVLQEAMIRAWKSLDSLRDDALAKQWLLTIVRHENARYYKRKAVETVDIDNLTPSQSATLAETEDSELNEMRAAIYELEIEYREPLVLQFIMGHSTQAIAELMGMQQGAVLTRLHRARNKLRKVFETNRANAYDRSEPSQPVEHIGPGTV